MTTKLAFNQIEDFVRVVNVKDYEATGDGVTDDTAAIQAALSEAKINNRILYFPKGTYLISSALENLTSSPLGDEAANGITIIGESRAHTIIKASPTFPASTAIINLDGNENGETVTANAVSQNYNVVRNLTLNCNNIADRGMRLRAVNYSVFEDLLIENVDGGASDAAILIVGTTVPANDDTDTTSNCTFNRVRVLGSGGYGVLAVSNRIATITFKDSDIRNCEYDGMRLAYADLVLEKVTIAGCGNASATSTGGFTAAKAATGTINRGLKLNSCQFENNYNHEVNIDSATGWAIEGGLFTPFVNAASGQDMIRVASTDTNEAHAGRIRGIRVAPYASAGPVIAGINIGGSCRDLSISDIGWDEVSLVWSTHDKRYTIDSESSGIKIEGNNVSKQGPNVAFEATSALSGSVIANITGDGTEYTTGDLSGTTIFADLNRGPQRDRLDITSATITGTSLNITSTPETNIQVGNRLTGDDVLPNTFITARVSGTGGTGTYTVSRSQTVSSQAMKAWDTQWFDRFSGTFTAPESGWYEFETKWPLTGFGGSETDIEVAIVVDPNGSPVRHIVSKETPVSALSAGDRNMYGGSRRLYLTSGDEVEASVKVSGGTKIVDLDRNFTGVSGFTFSGAKV